MSWLGNLAGPVRVAYEAGPTGFGLARASRRPGSAADEAARDLVRAREDARADLMRPRHRACKCGRCI